MQLFNKIGLLCYQALVLVLSPFVGLVFYFSKNGRVKIKERFGFNKIPDGAYECWWHAASIGEVQGLLPLLKLFKSPAILTVSSASALAVAVPNNITVRLAPFDALVFYRALFRNVRFKTLVVTETELWPGMLQFAMQRKTPISWVNMRLRVKSVRYYKFLRFIYQPLLKTANVFAATNTDAARWSEVFPALHPVQVCGNSKFDREPSVNSVIGAQAFQAQLFQTPADLLVLGSIHLPEFKLLLPQIAELLQDAAFKLQIVIAARHREKDAEFAQDLQQAGLSFERRSQQVSPTIERIVLLDTFGELERCYSCAKIAFIGGSLVALGGHNPLEAAQYGCALLMGPSRDVVKGVSDELIEADALIELSDSSLFKETVTELLMSPQTLKKISFSAKAVASQHRGASMRLAQLLTKEIKDFIPPNDESLSLTKLAFMSLASLYGAIMRLRNALYDAKILISYRSHLPVICVGNATVGGNGKTPLVLFLASALKEMGYSPVILSRGYGGSVKGPHLVDLDIDTFSRIGDEPLMMARRAICPVVIARNRVLGAKFIERRFPNSVIILDDGMQHRALDRALNLLCVAAGSEKEVAQFADGRLLPHGVLREDLRTSLKRADAIIWQSRSPQSPCAVPEGLLNSALPIFSTRVAVELLSGSNIVAPPVRCVLVTAVANADAVARSLKFLAPSIEIVAQINLNDHSRSFERELQQAHTDYPDTPIIITEKDAAKLTSQTAPNEALVLSITLKPVLPEAILALVKGVI